MSFRQRTKRGEPAPVVTLPVWLLGPLSAALAALTVACGAGAAGGSWEVVAIPTQAEIWGLSFLDERHGYLAGGGVFVDGGLVGRTLDGGLTWELESGLVKPRRGVSVFAFYDLDFVSPERGVLVGHTGLVLVTTTGWRGFSPVRRGAVYAHLRDVDFVDDRLGFAAGETRLLATRDGGATWGPRGPEGEPAPRVSARAIHFHDGAHGVLVGRHGRVRRTADGGRTWLQPERLPGADPQPHLFGVHFADPRSGWAVGERGTIWHTADGGSSWSAQTSGVGDTLMDVHFISPSRGWAVGHDRSLRRGVVLGTGDGGATWTVEVELPDEELFTLEALSTGHAWAVGTHVGPGGQRLLRRVP